MSARTSTRVTVVRATAQELLASLPDGSIDVVITDPPYTTVERSSGNGSHLQDWFQGGMTWPEIGRVLTLARRKLKPTGLIFVMTNAAGLREAITALEHAGFRDVRPITWDKRAPGWVAACATRRSSSSWAGSQDRVRSAGSTSCRCPRSARGPATATPPRSRRAWGARSPPSPALGEATWWSTRSRAPVRSSRARRSAGRRSSAPTSRPGPCAALPRAWLALRSPRLPPPASRRDLHLWAGARQGAGR